MYILHIKLGYEKITSSLKEQMIALCILTLRSLKMSIQNTSHKYLETSSTPDQLQVPERDRAISGSRTGLFMKFLANSMFELLKRETFLKPPRHNFHFWINYCFQVLHITSTRSQNWKWKGFLIFSWKTPEQSHCENVWDCFCQSWGLKLSNLFQKV